MKRNEAGAFNALLSEHAPGKVLAGVSLGQALGVVCIETQYLGRLEAAGTGVEALESQATGKANVCQLQGPRGSARRPPAPASTLMQGAPADA